MKTFSAYKNQCSLLSLSNLKILSCYFTSFHKQTTGSRVGYHFCSQHETYRPFRAGLGDIQKVASLTAMHWLCHMLKDLSEESVLNCWASVFVMVASSWKLSSDGRVQQEDLDSTVSAIISYFCPISIQFISNVEGTLDVSAVEGDEDVIESFFLARNDANVLEDHGNEDLPQDRDSEEGIGTIEEQLFTVALVKRI